MKIPAPSWLPALLLAAAVSFVAMGQQPALPPAPAAAPPVPQYQVEILVFANREFDPSEERFARELRAIELDPTAPLREAPVFDATTFPAPQLSLPADGVSGAAEFRFRLLRPDELQLGAEYQKLGRLPAYLPLLHAGWVQPGLPEEQSRPFDLSLLGALNPRGSVRVYLSRFLHVNLDVTYQGSTTTAAPTTSNGLDEIPLAPTFTLMTERNVRSGELHYFDHPAFGVLVKITPVPADTATSTGRRPAA
jgi:Peptidoglycan-binding protein, CsiV